MTRKRLFWIVVIPFLIVGAMTASVAIFGERKVVTFQEFVDQ